MGGEADGTDAPRWHMAASGAGDAQPASLRLTHPHVYSCTGCLTHVATHDHLISKAHAPAAARARAPDCRD